MNELDILCECGHSKKDHTAFLLGSDDKACGITEVNSIAWADDCKKYIPDNLLYIEKLAKEKGLV